jgi:hypothetical protein
MRHPESPRGGTCYATAFPSLDKSAYRHVGFAGFLLSGNAVYHALSQRKLMLDEFAKGRPQFPANLYSHIA